MHARARRQERGEGERNREIVRERESNRVRERERERGKKRNWRRGGSPCTSPRDGSHFYREEMRGER